MAVAQFEPHVCRAADDLLWRDAIDFVREGAHELDAAAGNDERLEAVRRADTEQLQHRADNHIGCRAVPFWDARGASHSLDDAIKLSVVTAAVVCRRIIFPGTRARRRSASGFMSLEQ